MLDTECLKEIPYFLMSSEFRSLENRLTKIGGTLSGSKTHFFTHRVENESQLSLLDWLNCNHVVDLLYFVFVCSAYKSFLPMIRTITLYGVWSLLVVASYLLHKYRRTCVMLVFLFRGFCLFHFEVFELSVLTFECCQITFLAWVEGAKKDAVITGSAFTYNRDFGFFVF